MVFSIRSKNIMVMVEQNGPVAVAWFKYPRKVAPLTDATQVLFPKPSPHELGSVPLELDASRYCSDGTLAPNLS